MAKTKAPEFQFEYDAYTRTNWVTVPTLAAQRRAQQAHRDALIAELGWKPEDPADRYLASSAELTRWVNEARAKAGKPGAVHVIITVPNTFYRAA